MTTLIYLLYIISSVITAAALCYGAYTDYKRREIPNPVCLIVALAWLLDMSTWSLSSILYRLASFGLIILVMVITYLLTKDVSGGGDIKLFLALAINMGFIAAMVVIAIAGVFAVVFSFVKRKSMKETVPVCTFVAPAYIIVQGAMMAMAFS